jgi:phospholipid/cholesterol/gamma-HCH transport system permease protein
VCRLSLQGDWCIPQADRIKLDAVLTAVGQQADARSVVLDARGLGQWDSALMTFLIDFLQGCAAHGIAVDVTELPPGIRSLLDLAAAVPERAGARRASVRVAWLAGVGENARRLWGDGLFLTRFVGETSLAALAFVTGRARFRRVDLWLQIQDCGPSAVPIVTLISLLVGLILAFVGAVQLALFGAQLYIADLVALGMTREMGALMTAIIMSGRSGAAFAAQIGTMNVNLEISALRVMGFDPMEFLVLPRMLALILVMPFLCLYADLMGIIGGGLVSVAFFDIPVTQFLHRTAESVHLTDFFVGVAKCALFGILIALAGCMRGMQCGRSASAVGDAATSAVVSGIVFIVVADSIVTLICDRLGI